MRCDAGRECVATESTLEARHDFAGYGFYLRYHGACCPGEVDGLTCRRDHPEGWRPETTKEDAMSWTDPDEKMTKPQPESPAAPTAGGEPLPPGAYVVMSGPPGPGAVAKATEALRRMPGWPSGIAGYLAAEMNADGGLCEFVEVETESGQGIGVTLTRRDDGFWALGPFLPATIETLERLAAQAVEATLANLLDRKGVGDAIEEVDPDIREDMTGELHRAVLRSWGRG